MEIITRDPPKAIEVGDIFEASWGWDQTNIDYYKVVRVTAKSAWLVPIAQKTVPGSEGFMSEDVLPDPDTVACVKCGMGEDYSYYHAADSTAGQAHKYVAPKPSLHRIQSGGYYDWALKVRGWGVWAHPWRGDSSYQSHYA